MVKIKEVIIKEDEIAIVYGVGMSSSRVSTLFPVFLEIF